MKRKHWRGLEILANTLLFLSSLLLLIDIAPRDFFPSHRERIRAVNALKQERNILDPVPSDVTVRPETRTMRISNDPTTYLILADLIKERSILASSIEWDHAVGVGYSTISVPVGGNKLDAFRALYVVLTPTGGGDRFRLVPVGQLEDLDAWLIEWRQGSLTATAIGLLTIGFFLHLCTHLSARKD